MAGQADVQVPLATNLQHITRIHPTAKVTILPGAGHYTFIETCLPAAIWRLGIICQDPTGVDRDSVHRVAVTEALRVFATALGNR